MKGYDYRFADDYFAKNSAKKNRPLLGYFIFLAIVALLLLWL